jgi:hypothetical protein
MDIPTIYIYTGLFLSPWNNLKIRNKYTTQRIMVILMPTEKETLQVFFFYIFHRCSMCPPLIITADIYAIVHLVPHACQHIMVDSHTHYYCLLAANQDNHVREISLKKKLRKVSLSISVRITMIRCVVYLLLIFKMVHRLINNPV